jgi:hypothetical protein
MEGWREGGTHLTTFLSTRATEDSVQSFPLKSLVHAHDALHR